MANVPAGLYYNPAAFRATGVGQHHHDAGSRRFGRGLRVLSLPHITNVDATMSKFFPLFGERRGLRIQAQAYNLFNHPEYNSVGTGLTWSATGAQTSLTARCF